MDIIHLCPSNLATGGTEGIHNLVHQLNISGANAKILYVGGDLSHPQPQEYKHYNCEYLVSFPKNFKGVVIFPEVWGNSVILEEYKNCATAINWQGVDVYDWHTPESERGAFLKNKNTVHIANSEYAVHHLHDLGVKNIVKISDCLNKAFYEVTETDVLRENTILYNPVSVKLTDFQKKVMVKCSDRGIKLKQLARYTRDELITLFCKSKLYIDFGVFSGRERLPREAVMCGCCILTSKLGTAGFYEDNSIPDSYKIDDVDTAMSMINHILQNYEQCKPDFDAYREALRRDKDNYPKEVEQLYNVLKGDL